MVTIGVAKAGSAWKVVSAVVVDQRRPDARRQGAPARRPGLAGRRRQRRPRQVAGADRAPAGQEGLGHGWKGLRVAGLGDVQQARQVAFPTVSHGYVPAYETLVVDTQAAEPAAYRVFVDARSGAVLARESLVDSEGDAAAARRRRPTRSTGTLPPEDGGCDTPKGPFTVAAADGVRAIDVFANADSVANDIVLNSPRRHRRRSPQADTVRTPERIRYAPDRTACPPGDYFVQLCEFEDGSAPVEPRTYTGTISFDTSAPPAPYTARWRAEPGQPAAQPAAHRSVEQPEHGHAREHGAGSRARRRRTATWSSATSRRARRGTSDPQANASTNTTAGNNARSAESWQDGGQPGPEPVPPGQHDARLHLPVDQRVVHTRTATRARPTARTSRSARASTSPRRR